MISSRIKEEPLTNESLADALDEVADLLESQGANPFRVRAYRRAAKTIHGLREPVGDILNAEGVAGLMQLPGIWPFVGPRARTLGPVWQVSIVAKVARRART